MGRKAPDCLNRLTRRAPDGWVPARFLSFFGGMALFVSRLFSRQRPLTPALRRPAANSNVLGRGGADLGNFTLIACLLGCLMGSCSPKQPPATHKQSTPTIGYPSAEAIVTSVNCGLSEEPPTGYLVVDDSVAIPVTAPEGQPLQASRGDFDQERGWYFDDHGRWLWAKSGLLVRGNTGIEISAPLDSPLHFDWGEEPNLVPRRSLRVECSQRTPHWMALIGGYFANSVGCFPLDIRVGDRPTVRVHVRMGAACLEGMETPSTVTP
jgi:hypothetical protein